MDILLNNLALNSIKAKVKNIHNYDGVSLVQFTFHKTTLDMMGLELPANIKEGTNVILGVKPSHVTIAKSYSLEISYSNRLKTNVIEIKEGKLLCNVIMSCNETKIEALITKKSKDNMHLKVGDKVTTLIKTSELFIKEVLDD